MSATLLGSKWSTKADLSVNVEAFTDADVPGDGKLDVTMGHFCHFNMDDGAHADYTRHFDWPVNGDFTVVVNATGVTVDDSSNALDVGVQGSVDGTNYVSLGAADAVIDGLVIGGGLAKAGVYDLDANGKMPYMRLVITAADASDSTIVVAVIPH